MTTPFTSGNPSMGAPKPTSNPFPPEQQAQMGAKKTHRGRRSKGKGPKAHQAEAKAHIQNASKATTPGAALPHLFAAVRSMHAAKNAAATPSDSTQTQSGPAGLATGGY